MKTYVKIPGPEFKSKAEAAWWERLVILYHAGEIQWFAYEPWGLRLGRPACVYWPDFIVIDKAGQVIAQEIKGTRFVKAGREKGMVKFKVAQETYPMIRFEMWIQDKISDFGWVEGR